jgi:outer membrane protein insertion porin family
MNSKNNIKGKRNSVPVRALGIWGSFLCLLFCLFLTACSGLSILKKNEKLYTGAQLKILSAEKVNSKSIKAATLGAMRQKPNSSYLGIRPQLLLYKAAGPNPKSKYRKWLKNNGEAPVLISNVNPGATAAVIDAKLFNIGIFNSYTVFKIIEKKHTASVIYTTHVHQPFKIKALAYNIADDSLRKIVVSDKENSLINVDDEYNLLKLKEERIRIDELLKNRGYFYFNPDYLVFKADTSSVNHTISFTLSLKDSIPVIAKTAYRINNVYIDQNYSLRDQPTDSLKDTIMVQKAVFKGKNANMNIRPKVILRSVYLRKDELYSRENHTITLNRLMSMGNFKFVQVLFAESDTAATGYLDATILMTPMTEHTFRAELDLVTKSNSYTGPRMNLSLLNRNTFKGAELLNLSLAGSFEAQISGANKNAFSYAINPQIELTFPKFLVPFHVKPSNSIYIPKTNLLLSYNYLKRVNYFDMSTIQLGYGFKWKASFRTEHELMPLNISYTTIGNKSAVFQTLLDSIPFLKKSYEEQFIVGANYSFTYNEQVLKDKKVQYYLHFTAETAGNLFSLAELIAGNKSTPNDPLKILGSVYSQYAKLSVDGRVYCNFNKNDKLAFRLFAGVADAYGNSSVLPYNKQFFSGGPNSVRAFQINALGPGTYHQTTTNSVFLQLGGDIKLETNAEYRFGIYKFIKGALFVDAGNVWLQKSNTSAIGTPFTAGSFMKEMAVGAGFGLRFDVSFFVLRFDVATPLRKPWLVNNRWVINQINFGSGTWRSENLVLNIAIGYPF